MRSSLREWDLAPYQNTQLEGMSAVLHMLYFMRKMGFWEEPIWNGEVAREKTYFHWNLSLVTIILQFPIESMYPTTYINLYWGQTSINSPHYLFSLHFYHFYYTCDKPPMDIWTFVSPLWINDVFIRKPL